MVFEPGLATLGVVGVCFVMGRVGRLRVHAAARVALVDIAAVQVP